MKPRENQRKAAADDVVSAVSGLVVENQYLRSMLSMYEERYIDSDKFYDVPLTTDMVAKLHGVCNALVRKYLAMGLIEPHPMSGESKFFIRASDALRIDFSELKKKAKYNLK